MKKQLPKKIYVLIVTAMIFSIIANAQIVYTDVIPDDTISCIGTYSNCSSAYNLDLNNDANIDFMLSIDHFFLGYCNDMAPPSVKVGAYVSAIGANAFYGIMSSNPSALNYQDTINNNLTWVKAKDTLRHVNRFCGSPFYTVGNWGAGVDHYLPVKIIITGSSHFGWVRMNVSANIGGSQIIIGDYAYNSIPNQFILAGDRGTGPTGINENIASSSINLYPNPAINQLTIALPGSNQKTNVTITDIAGKIVYTTATRETQKVEVNTKDFAEGVYLVQIKSNDLIETKKLIIEK